MSNECWSGLVWFDEQLFESQSVIEYWENFASHAFENTTQSVFSHCVLLKPGGEPIPCTFCFSIRRDIFDMPSVVIGEFFLWYFIRCEGVGLADWITPFFLFLFLLHATAFVCVCDGYL